MAILRNLMQKYPVMGYFCWRTSPTFFAILFLIVSCAHPPQAPPPETPITPTEPSVPEVVTTVEVMIDRENIRDFPNGKIIGELAKGDWVSIIIPRGNWMYCNIGDTLEGYIWAPSLGFSKFSFLNIQTYFPGDDHKASPMDSLMNRLGPPMATSRESVHCQRLVYDNVSQNALYPFGAHDFRRLELTVVNGVVMEVAIDLGTREALQSDLLSVIGLPAERATDSGFKDVQWDNVFRGLERVVFERNKGSFKSFSWIRIYKVNPERWKRKLTIAHQSCQIGENNDVNVYIIAENADDMAYSDFEFQVNFYDNNRTLIHRDTIGPLPDVLVPRGRCELFVDQVFPMLAGRKDVNFFVEFVFARPLLTDVSP